MRRYYFNVGGFRGVHYDRKSHYYFVWMYTGTGADYLLGNEMPDWGGNIWFSDRTAALIARDKERRWRPYVKWPPDIEQSEDEQFSLVSGPGGFAPFAQVAAGPLAAPVGSDLDFTGLA
jgi:hypothetical protein